jgi:hypothetical protein
MICYILLVLLALTLRKSAVLLDFGTTLFKASESISKVGSTNPAIQLSLRYDVKTYNRVLGLRSLASGKPTYLALLHCILELANIFY